MCVFVCAMRECEGTYLRVFVFAMRECVRGLKCVCLCVQCTMREYVFEGILTCVCLCVRRAGHPTTLHVIDR